MKTILITLMILASGCSATLLNRGSPFVVPNQCQLGLAPVADAAASAASLLVATRKTREHERAILIGTSTVFAISTIMGSGEVSECINAEVQ